MPGELTAIREALTDGQLLAAFADERDQPAFAELVRRHGGMVLGACRAMAGPADAEDAAQAVFLALALKAASLRKSKTVAGWLYRVAGYVALNSRRAERTRRGHEREAARMKSEAAAIRAELPPNCLHAALAKLPEKYRLALVLHHLEGHTQKETASLLGCTPAAAAVRLNRGRKMLLDRLTRGTPTDVSAALAASTAAGAPPLFVARTTQAAVSAATGQIAAGTSASTPMLAKGALSTLLAERIRAALLIAAVLLLGIGVAAAIRMCLTGTDPPRPAPAATIAIPPSPLAAAASPPDQATLRALDAYARNLDWEKSVSMIADTDHSIPHPFPPRTITRQREHIEFYRDGNSLSFDVTAKIHDPTSSPQDSSRFTRSIVVNNQIYSHPSESQSGTDSLFTESDADGGRRDMLEPYLGLLDGYIYGCKEEMVADVLRTAPTIRMHPTPETVDGVSCEVIEASGPEGQFCAWLSPEQNYALRKLTVIRDATDLVNGKPLSGERISPQEGDQFAKFTTTLDHVENKKVGGFWVPYRGTVVITQQLKNGQTQVETDTYVRTAIQLKPDFAKLKPFVLNVPDGTPVMDMDRQNNGLHYVWRKGKIEAVPNAPEPNGGL